MVLKARDQMAAVTLLFFQLNGPEIKSLLFLKCCDPQKEDEKLFCLCHWEKQMKHIGNSDVSSPSLIFHSTPSILLFDSKASFGELAVQGQG